VFSEEHGEAAVQRTNELASQQHSRYILDADQRAEESRNLLHSVARWDRMQAKPSLWQPAHLRQPPTLDVMVHHCMFLDYARPRLWDWRDKILGELGKFCAQHDHYCDMFRMLSDGSVLLLLNDEDPDAYVVCRCRCCTTRNIGWILSWQVPADGASCGASPAAAPPCDAC